jgi:hypothetical protein
MGWYLDGVGVVSVQRSMREAARTVQISVAHGAAMRTHRLLRLGRASSPGLLTLRSTLLLS